MKDIGFTPIAKFSDEQWEQAMNIWRKMFGMMDEYVAAHILDLEENNYLLEEDDTYPILGLDGLPITTAENCIFNDKLIFTKPNLRCSDVVLAKSKDDYDYVGEEGFVVYKVRGEFYGLLFCCYLYAVQQLVPGTIIELYEWDEEDCEVSDRFQTLTFKLINSTRG